MVRFEVEDQGIGIAAEQQALIFEAFRQTEAGIRAGGTGLGLSIASQLTRALRGKMEVRSEEGKGSSFIVCIPRASAEPNEASSA
jgi:signal transduction histidine kinase